MMRNMVWIFLLDGFFITAFSQSKDLETMKNVELAWYKALPKKDTAALEQIFADDVVFVNSSGVAISKKEILHIVMDPHREYLSASIDSVLLSKSTGNTGVMVVKTTIERKLYNEMAVLKFCVMTHFEKRKGRWVISSVLNELYK